MTLAPGTTIAQTHTNRHKPTCTCTVTAGTLSQQGLVQRTDSASKKLPTGRHTLVIVARAFGKTSTPARLTFAIVTK